MMYGEKKKKHIFVQFSEKPGLAEKEFTLLSKLTCLFLMTVHKGSVLSTRWIHCSKPECPCSQLGTQTVPQTVTSRWLKASQASVLQAEKVFAVDSHGEGHWLDLKHSVLIRFTSKHSLL